ncbi:hypothetical protein [Neolewinella persica]|uniref:hypothetical protein n=1 Tax=Neolewinella persica TaxID=70998 RepID=UPI000382984B|nr:hypothetical protein [Neolewinella persica]
MKKYILCLLASTLWFLSQGIQGQALTNGVRVVNLKVDYDEEGQGTVFRRNGERLVVTAGHVVKNGAVVEVVSELNGAKSEASGVHLFSGLDLGTVTWPGQAYLEELRPWKVGGNYRKLLRTGKDFRLVTRDKDGRESRREVRVVGAEDDKLDIHFVRDFTFEEGESGGALILRPKSGKDIYMGLLYEKSGDGATGYVYPADVMDDLIKRRMKEIKSSSVRKLIPAIGYLGAVVAVGTGYLSTYQNAEKVYEDYANNLQESTYAALNTGFSSRGAAYKESERLRKKSLRLYMVGGGLAVGSALYQLVTKPSKIDKPVDNDFEFKVESSGVSLTYTF